MCNFFYTENWVFWVKSVAREKKKNCNLILRIENWICDTTIYVHDLITTTENDHHLIACLD
jgi:hypothetical protein